MITDEPTTLRCQTVLIMFLVLTIITAGCISETESYNLSCVEIDISDGNVTEDEIRHYQNLSSENQILFKKAIGGTQVDEPYTPSLSEKFVRYENRTYECDTHKHRGA